MEHGSYYCSRPGCDLVIHVKCSIESKHFYDIIEVDSLDYIDEFDLMMSDGSLSPIIRVIEEIEVRDEIMAAKIIHFCHEQHVLTFSNVTKDNKHHCDGCVLPIVSPFYYGSQCDFFLHKACAELPRKTRTWCDSRPFTLIPNGIFKCYLCSYECSGFSYKLDGDEDEAVLCLQSAALSHSFTYQAEEPHYLFFNRRYGHCRACGRYTNVLWRCKDCDFALDFTCVLLPKTVWHKCDKHSLTLAYKEHGDYPLRHYCDICEKRRNPMHWFYNCVVCDKAMHLKCVLGKYPLIKHGSTYKYENHPHPITFVQKIYYYPECVVCGEPCQDLSLECLEHGCNYIVHWKCIKLTYSSSSDGDSE